MKNTGMTRKLDDLGRVVIPAEIRKSFNIREGDHLDISVEEDRIILTRRQEACIFCRSMQDLKEYRGKMICAPCIEELGGGPVSQARDAAWEPFVET